MIVVRIFFFLLFIISSDLYAKDLIPNLFKNSIATFTDAAKMLYDSFNIAEMSRKNKMKKKRDIDLVKKNHEISPEEVRSFLQSKGISASLLSQPMAKKDFAKLLFQRFKNIPRGFLTQSLKIDKLYFNDAQSLNIFSVSELAEETLTLKDMLGSFLKASKLANLFLSK